MTQATQTPPWTVSGEYFENCNCDVVCPCEVGPGGPLTARPDPGFCDVFLVFHLESGRFGDVDLAGLNAGLAFHTPGPMGEGNWTAAAYLDARGDAKQQQALGAIFSGAAGGPPGALAPLIANFLGAKAVTIEYENAGKQRSARIPGILDSTIAAVPGSQVRDEPVIKRNAHPLFPELTQAYGVRTTYNDYDFRWDNTGKCADFATFRWSVG